MPSPAGSSHFHASLFIEEEVVRIEALAERNRGAAAPRRTTRQTARAAAKRQRA